MKNIITFTLLLIIAIASFGQEEKELPGDTSLPSSAADLEALSKFETKTYAYSVKDYFQRPAQRSFRFSPDGKYLSYREKAEDGKNHVYVKNTATGDVQLAIEEKEDLIRRYSWANNTRLIYMQDKGGNENYHLFAVNLDGTEQKELTPVEHVRVDVINDLEDDDEHIIITMNLDNPQIFEPFKINLRTGETTKLYENKDPENPIDGYEFDKDGVLRGYGKQHNGTEFQFFYRENDKEEFALVKEITWKDDFSLISFDYETEDPNDAYMISNLENNTAEIIRYDLKNGKVLERIWSHSTYDAGGISFSRKRGYEPDYYYYTGERYETVPVSETYTALDKKLAVQFDGYDVYISSKTKDESKYLLYVTSDRLYGKYYMYDAVADSFSELLNLMPTLKEKDMAEMRPLSFKTRDGLTVHAYLTIPNGIKEGEKVPMIVNPHGGPYGPRDEWGFNPETQLFASRGYTTLQINYRGSGGYGKNFSMAGNKQIGRKMLNDLEDGVAYAKTLGLIDEKRIAIYGGSYGGLATLGSLVKTPDLYCCGVDYVGVSNLFTFFSSFPEYWKPYLEIVYQQWYDETDPIDQKIMTAVSPALNVDKITKPLFVIQGANDPRVNIDESDQVVSQLRARGVDVPYMVKYDEGHGFGREENRIEVYQSMMGFFAKHLN